VKALSRPSQGFVRPAHRGRCRERTAQGGYLVWLDESVVSNLERLRGPRDEDLSAVIVRLFGEQANEQIAELFGSEQGPSEEGP
jgi:hypothetical protein